MGDPLAVHGVERADDMHAKSSASSIATDKECIAGYPECNHLDRKRPMMRCGLPADRSFLTAQWLSFPFATIQSGLLVTIERGIDRQLDTSPIGRTARTTLQLGTEQSSFGHYASVL
jgi:hypothetical protein